jgi:cation-transporting ATPase 13A3/4/5
MGYPAPWWFIPAYNSPLHHNVMPMPYRVALFFLCLGNVIAVVLFEYVIVLGPLRVWLSTKYGRKRAQLTL